MELRHRRKSTREPLGTGLGQDWEEETPKELSAPSVPGKPCQGHRSLPGPPCVAGPQGSCGLAGSEPARPAAFTGGLASLGIGLCRMFDIFCDDETAQPPPEVELTCAIPGVSGSQ